MQVYNCRESLTQSVFSFLHKDGPDVEYEYKNRTHRRRPRENELDVVYFMQSWGSTAMGFGGVGGAAMTDAYTTVIRFRSRAYIYFDGRFFCSCEDDKNFRELLNKRQIPGVHDKDYKKLTDKVKAK